jgi:hypothetical protein
MEIYCSPRDAGSILDAARDHGIDAQPIGRTVKSEDGKNQLTLTHGAQRLRYLAP